MAKSKKRWIQDVATSIKKRGTEGVCTGSKFGGPTCRPGTKRYNLAKTFKKIARNSKKKEDGGLLGESQINVERNELEVNPKTLEVVQDFANKPNHPLIGINPKGNVNANVGNVIIPQEYRETYLKGDNTIKQKIIALVIQNTKGNNKMQDGGPIKKPDDYSSFEYYSKTAPTNRQIHPDYEYGNPRQYDAYGFWDALGKPKDWETALKMNPEWKPNEYDNTYHGFSVNPKTGVWLKPHIPGGKEPGNTAWMEYMEFALSGDKDFGPKSQELVYDTDLKRMKYIPKKQKGSLVKNNRIFKIK
jgi:hypothetical protein